LVILYKRRPKLPSLSVVLMMNAAMSTGRKWGICRIIQDESPQSVDDPIQWRAVWAATHSERTQVLRKNKQILAALDSPDHLHARAAGAAAATADSGG
jgi:hypothetical protein